MLLVKFIPYSKIWCSRSVSMLGMAFSLPLRGFKMLLLLFYRVELLLAFLTRCEQWSPSSWNQALCFPLWSGTFGFWTQSVSIWLLYSHIIAVLILLPLRIMSCLVSFIRVAFSYGELAEGASRLAHQGLFMGVRMLFSSLYTNLLWAKSLGITFFILLVSRTSASGAGLLFNGLISDFLLLCLFGAWAARQFSGELRASISRAMRGVPRFWLTLDILMRWCLSMIVLGYVLIIFTRIQIIADAREIVRVLLLRRLRRILLHIILGYWIRLLLLISRLKKWATKVAWDEETVIWLAVNAVTSRAPFRIILIGNVIKTSVTLKASRLWELASVGEVRHISWRAQTSLRLWMDKRAPCISIILVIVKLIVAQLRRVWTVIGRAWITLSLAQIKGLIGRHVGCATGLQRWVGIARCLCVSYETNWLCDRRLWRLIELAHHLVRDVLLALVHGRMLLLRIIVRGYKGLAFWRQLGVRTVEPLLVLLELLSGI